MIETLAKMATALAEAYTVKKAKERADTITDLKNQIDAENNRGQLADDGLLEDLEARLQNECEGLLMDLAAAGVLK